LKRRGGTQKEGVERRKGGLLGAGAGEVRGIVVLEDGGRGKTQAWTVSCGKIKKNKVSLAKRMSWEKRSDKSFSWEREKTSHGEPSSDQSGRYGKICGGIRR